MDDSLLTDAEYDAKREIKRNERIGKMYTREKVAKVLLHLSIMRGKANEKQKQKLSILPIQAKAEVAKSEYCKMILAAMAFDALMGISKMTPSQWKAHAFLTELNKPPPPPPEPKAAAAAAAPIKAEAKDTTPKMLPSNTIIDVSAEEMQIPGSSKEHVQ